MKAVSKKSRSVVVLETINCPICSSPHPKKLFDVPSEPLEFGLLFGIARCETCGLVFTNPRPTESEMARFYGESYYGPKHRRFLWPFEWVETFFRFRRVKNIEHFKKTGRILDVGCGRAQMLTLMRKRGWEVYGTEWTEESTHNARKILGSHIMVGEVFNLELPDQHFDCITLWHVFEHTYHPRKILAEISSIIKPGGLLIIALHNFDSRMARFGGRNWFNFDSPRHLMHFTPAQLQKLLGEYGLKSVETSHFSLEFDPYCWLQTLYNKLGFEHNLLYTMIRRRDWWQQFTFRKFFQTVGILLALLPLGAIAGTMAMVDGLAKQNGTFINYAIKESSVDKNLQGG